MSAARRTPQQQRSRALVESILDSAAELLSTRQAHELTTTMIATGAGCSAAALYRFYPNREAVFIELGNRYRQQLAAMYESLLDRPGDRDPFSAARDVFDRLISFVRTEAGFRNLWWSGLIDSTTIGADRRDGKRYIAAGLHALFHPHSHPSDRPSTGYVVCVEVADHLIGLAFQNDATGDPALLDETLRLLTLHLTQLAAREA